MTRKILIALFIVVLTIPLSSMVVAAGPAANNVSDGFAVTRVDSILEAKPLNPAAAKTPPSVVIVSPEDEITVSGTITVSATVTDAQGVKKVEYSVDDTDWVVMTGTDGVYIASWNSTTVSDGDHTITVRATDKLNAKGYASVNVNVSNGVTPPPPSPATADYELFIEIDYIEGHEPTQEVLDYIEWYYMGNNPSGDMIDVTFNVNPVVLPAGVNASDGISESEFWAIETLNNAGVDNTGVSENGLFDSKNKWVLFGTSVEDSPNTMGYCYITGTRKDVTAGNYIFIADESTDNWENSYSVVDSGAEVTVLMHELGHSIGIAKMNPVLGETYDPDSYSVMSYLSVNNATQYGTWYYSDSYWGTRNLEYYEVVS